jgi:hypothetical protein
MTLAEIVPALVRIVGLVYPEECFSKVSIVLD